MSFKASINCGTFQDSIDAVTPVVDETVYHLDEDGMQALAVDPANVNMIDHTLDAGAFETYNADGGEIGVNLNRLEDVVNMGDSGDTVEMEINQETRKLELVIGGLSYTLALIDPDSIREEPDIPDLDLPTTATMELSDLKRGIKASAMVSDHMRLRSDPDEEVFIMEAEGDTDDVDLELTTDDLIHADFGEANSLFSVDYFKEMQKGIPNGAEVTIEIGEEFPMMMEFQFAEGDANVTYMLAPRIQSD